MSENFPSFRRFFRAIDAAPKVIFLALYDRRRTIVIVAVALLVLHLTATITTQVMMDREIARAEAAGEMLSYASLWAELPTGKKNAAKTYLRAFDALRFSRDEFRAKDYAEWGPQWTTNARQLVTANPSALSFLKKASQIPYLGNLHFKASLYPESDLFQGMQKLAALVEAKATVAVADGKPEEALAACAILLRMADHSLRLPGGKGYFSGFVRYRRALEVLEKVLSRTDPSPAACRRFSTQMGQVDIRARFKEARREYVSADGWQLYAAVLSPRYAEEFSEIEYEIRDKHPHPRWAQFLVRCDPTLCRPLLNLDRLVYIRAMQQREKAANLPWPQSDRRLKDIDKGENLARSPWIITWLATLGMTDLYARHPNGAVAHYGASQIALALKAYKGEQGRYPNSLADLEEAGWKLPTDPFTGKPYHYRKERKGFLLWSLGPDMQDDGGVFRRPLYRKGEYLQQPYDVPVRVTR